MHNDSNGVLYKVCVCFAFVFFLSQMVFAQNFSRTATSIKNAESARDAVQNLLVSLVDSKNYVAEECGFILDIPSVKTTEVSASLPDLPQNAAFVSMRLFDYTDSEKKTGTRIELWLQFSEPGTYKLNPLSVTIKKRTYKIPFSQVKITENPKNMFPILVVDFEDGPSISSQKNTPQKITPLFSVPVSSSVRFTVSLRYALQLVSLHWTLSKDSLFTELARYEIPHGGEKDALSLEAKAPIAKFEWQPLVTGEMSLPSLTIVATAPNGARTELYMPDYFINVTDAASKKGDGARQTDYFPDAFSDSSANRDVAIRLSPSKSDCEKIAELRTKERRDFPLGKIKKERAEFEKSVGIVQSDDEPVYFVRNMFAFFSVLSVVFVLLSIVIKKMPHVLAVVSSFFLIVCCVFFSLSLKKLSMEYGIFAGGGLRSVPEEGALPFESLESGMRVKIEHKTGDWIYISVGNAGGWTNKKNVILIR